jgi:hypothetical protein
LQKAADKADNPFLLHGKRLHSHRLSAGCFLPFVQLVRQARLESGAFVLVNNPFAHRSIYATYGRHGLVLCRFFPGTDRASGLDYVGLKTTAYQTVP